MDTVVFTVPQFYALIGGDLVASNHLDDTVPGGSLKHRECLSQVHQSYALTLVCIPEEAWWSAPSTCNIQHIWPLA